jgi:hypothetical protein
MTSTVVEDDQQQYECDAAPIDATELPLIEQALVGASSLFC